MSKRTIKCLGPTGRFTRAQIRAAVDVVREVNKGKKYPLIKSAEDTASGSGAITFRFVHFFEQGTVPADAQRKPRVRRKTVRPQVG